MFTRGYGSVTIHGTDNFVMGKGGGVCPQRQVARTKKLNLIMRGRGIQNNAVLKKCQSHLRVLFGVLVDKGQVLLVHEKTREAFEGQLAQSSHLRVRLMTLQNGKKNIQG